MMIAKSARAVMAAIVLAVMLVPSLAAAPADGRHPGTKLTGVVTAVDPAHLSLRGDNGRQVTLETSEDYTQRLAVGAEVTAWYSSKGGANTLELLDGPRDSFFVPAEEIRRRIRKVVILPESSVPGADPLFDAMQNYLETRAGWYVAARRLVAEVLSAALKSQAAASPSRPLSSTLGAINPETGEFDMAAYERGAAPTQAQTEAKGQEKAPPAAPAGPAAQASSTLDAINPATGEFDMTRYAPDEPAKQDSSVGKPAATASQAQTATAAPAASPLDAIDPATGNFDMTRYLQAQAAAQPVASGVAPSRPTDDPRLVARVASLIRVDGVLEAQVVQVQAPVSRLVAKWDGAEEPIGGKGSETVAHLALAARHGSVPAATVVLKLWDSQGNLLWTDRTGFAVLAVHEGLRNAMRERPLAEVLNNRATLDQWMNGVFSPLLADHTSTSATSRKR